MPSVQEILENLKDYDIQVLQRDGMKGGMKDGKWYWRILYRNILIWSDRYARPTPDDAIEAGVYWLLFRYEFLQEGGL